MFKAYFEPLPKSLLMLNDKQLMDDSLGLGIDAYWQDEEFPSYEGVNIAIIGVGDNRGAYCNQNATDGMNVVREKLYQLKLHHSPLKIVDFGNIKPGATIEDTYAAIASIVSELIPLRIIPIILGGSQDLTYGHYSAYKKLEQIINIVSVDAAFNLGKPEEELTSENYLGKIILEQPNYLFNFSNIGYQTYFVGKEGVELMKKLYFDTYRLGQVRADIQEAEPIVRNADLLTFDMSAVRQSDAPGNAMATPNGFYGEEACQIMMYAGISDKLSGIGIYEYDNRLDRDKQTAHLIAQMIWCFIDGICNRKSDLPHASPGNYITYRVAVQDLENEITFVKSIKSDRWWMKLPIDSKRNRYVSHHLLPCSYKDYQQACNNEVPDRWWNALQKMV